MLAQILQDLYVPRELLDELPEDQKQLLFFKMREEQVRRYHQREQEESRTNINVKKEKKKKKQVTFQLGADGNEWCWIMGETNQPLNTISNRSNNENMDIDYQSNKTSSRTNESTNHNFTLKNGAYYTAHRDERKHIEEISNNIQEARRIFELLESETRRLALTKENELLQKQSRSSSQLSQSDFVDEVFYHEIEERAKKADRERREAARRARDFYNRHSSLSNICFDTDNDSIIELHPMPLNSSIRSTSKRETDIPAFPDESIVTTAQQQTQPLLPITRDDIRQWFRTCEIPYGTFRMSNGEIYPWFHGIISRAHAEQLLSTKPIGSYLIRISEKIFGYVLSYHASDHCRHLLIEVNPTERTYRFLGGAKKESFENLIQLIEKYSNTPIRSNSTDVLRYPCGQFHSEQIDYNDLFTDNYENEKAYESLYISLDTTTSSIQSNTHL